MSRATSVARSAFSDAVGGSEPISTAAEGCARSTAVSDTTSARSCIDRDTVAGIAGAGFAIDKCDRFMHADGALEPAIPHVIGTARRSG